MENPMYQELLQHEERNASAEIVTNEEIKESKPPILLATVSEKKTTRNVISLREEGAAIKSDICPDSDTGMLKVPYEFLSITLLEYVEHLMDQEKRYRDNGIDETIVNLCEKELQHDDCVQVKTSRRRLADFRRNLRSVTRNIFCDFEIWIWRLLSIILAVTVVILIFYPRIQNYQTIENEFFE
ncbi:GfV-B9-ORF1 [Ichnoviriform fumiferanae]|uniref:GfV-B9-ORF1 n=1 Tax=Ichnoviriform fumiferanae TaxID=419435 RepID=A2PZQ9_9VIRU|nr:GfV-B9-ORF1 [Ichnoviriform fumiferanae]BAF45481.1 GfV-B9-ORF1 [Ichnoviriform fumiferanae]